MGRGFTFGGQESHLSVFGTRECKIQGKKLPRNNNLSLYNQCQKTASLKAIQLPPNHALALQ